jgi:hypothetical protein
MRALRYGAGVLLFAAAMGAAVRHPAPPTDPCPSIVSAIVSTGAYAGGEDVRACVGEEDDPRVSALLDLSTRKGGN